MPLSATLNTHLNIDLIWSDFISSERGRKAVHRFESKSIEDLLSFYNPDFIRHINTETVIDIAESLYCYGFSELDRPTTTDEANDCLLNIGYFGIWEENDILIPPADFKLLTDLITPLSFAASTFAPDFFYPYLFALRFSDLVDICNLFQIELPDIPKRNDYKGRYEYYWQICDIFSKIRNQFGLTHSETCVFLYDFLPYITKSQCAPLAEATQCWFIGGPISEIDKAEPTTIWQTNIDTRPGDILVHYETSPKSAVTTIWRSLSQSYIDPFFHWHSYSRIGFRIDIPHITLSELRQDEYFATFPLTKKNFQGVNGFPMPAAAYNRLLTLLQQKGFAASELPLLYAPDFDDNGDVKNENDVEEMLLIPLLQSLGLEENVHFKRQVGIHIGRGHRVFPDYIVYFKMVDDADEARILIEAKFDMRNRKDVEKAFRQAKSYALNLKSEYIILCDKKHLIIYRKTGNDFNIDKYTVYSWKDIENPDNFNKLNIIFNQSNS